MIGAGTKAGLILHALRQTGKENITLERSLYCRQASEKMEVSLPPAVIEKDF